MIAVHENIIIEESEYELSFARSSGPGGQNVNKVSSKALLRWRTHKNTSIPAPALVRFKQRFANKINQDGELLVSSDAHREQSRNIEECKGKLVTWILECLFPPKPRKKTKPSKRQIQARLDEKKKQAERKRRRRWTPPT